MVVNFLLKGHQESKVIPEIPIYEIHNNNAMACSGVIVCALAASLPSESAARTRIRALNSRKLQQNNRHCEGGFDGAIEIKCDNDNNDVGTNGMIVLALASPSPSAVGARSRELGRGKLALCDVGRDVGPGGVKQKRGKRKRRNENCTGSGNGDAFVRVVSPYFEEKKEGQGDKGNVVVRKQRKTKRRRENERCSSAVEIGGGEVLNAEATGFVRVSPYFQKEIAVSSTCSKGERIGDVYPTEKMVEASVLQEIENDRNACGMEKAEQCIGGRNLRRHQSSDTPQEGDDCKIMVEDLKKQNVLEMKKMLRKVPAVTCDDSLRIVSQYFVRKVSGSNTSKTVKKVGKKRKQKPVDQLHRESEMTVVCTDSVQNISPCSWTPGVDDRGEEKNDDMEKKADKKVKKKKMRKKTKCDEDNEKETKTETSKKLMRKRKEKKRAHDDQHCQEAIGENEDSALRPQSADSACVVFKANNEAAHKAGEKKVVTSAPAGLGGVANHIVSATTKKVCPYFDQEESKENLSYGEIEKAAVYTELPQDGSPCFSTLGVDGHGNRKTKNSKKETEKKVKRERNKRKKIACDEDLDMGTVKVKKQKKNKKRVPDEGHCQESKDEDEDPVRVPQHASSTCSGVEGKNKVEHKRGEKKVAVKSNQVLCRETKKVSPYFNHSLEKEGCDDRQDKSGAEHPGKTMCIEFEEILSKYAYKCESQMNKAMNEVNGSAREQDERRKRWRKIAHGTLNAKEKLAEAYRRKAPDSTWVPPRSPYNLLQEDHAHDPWRVLVICMLLNMTTGVQVRDVLWDLFSLCPNAEAAIDADPIELQSVIQSLGLQRKRAAMIQRFSREYLSDKWTHVTQLHGIGKYGADAYAIFCTGMWHQVKPNDHMLNYYWKFLHRLVIQVGK